MLNQVLRRNMKSACISSNEPSAGARKQRQHYPHKLLLVFLAFSVIGAGAQVRDQRQPAKGKGQSLSIVVTQIGEAAVQSKPQTVSGPKARIAYYYANRREMVAGKLLGLGPFGMNLYPLVRREGAEKWQIQTVALKTPDRGNGSDWKAEVRFGDQTDDGGSFELRVVASREPLPLGPVSFDILSRNAVSMSGIIRVRRRVEGLTVWVPYINNIPVYGNELIDVKLQAPVEVRARALPPEAQIGVAVQPVKPWTDRHWVMEGTVIGHEGPIIAHFGRLGLDGFDEFEVLAFVAWQDDFPPRAAGIQQADWERMESRFLAKSRVVRVIRWEGEFKILEIDGKKVIPRLTLPVDSQSDIYGAVDRPFNQGEKVWIICLPKVGEPWVAGWTNELHPAGRWVVNAARLWNEGQPKLIDIVAVIATEDPTKVKPADLRSWIYRTRRPLKTARVFVANSSAQ